MRFLPAHFSNLPLVGSMTTNSRVPATNHSFLSSGNLIRLHSAPLSNHWWRPFEWDWIQCLTLRYADSHWPPTRLHITDPHALDAAIQPVFNTPHLFAHPAQPLSVSLWKYYEMQSWKRYWNQGKQYSLLSLIYQANLFIASYQADQAQLFLDPCWLFSSWSPSPEWKCFPGLATTSLSQGLRWGGWICISHRSFFLLFLKI